MPRPRIFAAAVVRRIPRLVDQGLGAAEIAESIGCTVGTLRVRCSQLGISLRRKSLNDQPKAPPSNASFSAHGAGKCPPARMEGKVELAILISNGTAERLRQHASAKRMSYQALAACLLEVIARDRLYDAVLDGHDVEDIQATWRVKVP